MTPDELAAFFHEAYERLAPQFGYETRPDTKVLDFNSPNGRLMVAVCTEIIAHARQQSAEEIANLDRDELIRIAKDAGFEASWIYKIPRLPDFLERFAAMLETPQRLREIDRALDDVEYSGHYENGIYALKAQNEALRNTLLILKKAKILYDMYPKFGGKSYGNMIDAAIAQEVRK